MKIVPLFCKDSNNEANKQKVAKGNNKLLKWILKSLLESCEKAGGRQREVSYLEYKTINN